MKGGKVYKGIIKWRKTCWDKKEGGIEILLTLTESGKKNRREMKKTNKRIMFNKADYYSLFKNYLRE